MLLALWLVSFARAEDAWVASAADLQRWPDKAYVVSTVAVGDKVSVLLRDGDRVRVRKGMDFGWVAAASLSSTPVAAEAPAFDLSSLGDLGGAGLSFPGSAPGK